MAKTAWLALALLGVGCSDRRVTPEPQPLRPCVVAGIGRAAECGFVAVPEVPGRPRELQLDVVRVPARARDAKGKALFLLAGGPGQAATRAFPKLWPVYAQLAETRDVVLVDVRGTGGSAPLDCPKNEDVSEAFRTGTLTEAAERCAKSLGDRPLDAYGTDALVRDLEAVRVALGYGSVDLLGVSYGTRLALAYAASHPDGVRSLVLDGVVPPELVLGERFGRDGQAALDGLFADCAADEGCRGAFPDAGAKFSRFLDDLARTPATVDLLHPETGAPMRVSVERDGLASAVRSLLYAPEFASLLPMTLAEVERARYQGLFAQVAALSRSADDGMSLGLLFTIACAEDVPRFRDAERDGEKASLLGAALFDDFRAACARWPGKPRPPVQLPASLQVPTLLLSGALDPVTPPHWAESLRARLPRGKHVVVPHAGHSVWARGCVPTIVERFLETGSADGLDVGCVGEYRRPEFFLDRGGPRP